MNRSVQDECEMNRSGEGQNVCGMISFQPLGPRLSEGETKSTLFRLTNHSDIWLLQQPEAEKQRLSLIVK